MNNKSNYTPNFKVPDNYFEELDERIMQNIRLEGVPKETGFSVPDDYFNTVEKSVFQQIHKEVPTPMTAPKVIPLYKRPVFIMTTSIAACVALLVAIVNLNSGTAELDTIQETAISTYIEEGNLDYTYNDLLIYFQEMDLNSILSASDGISNENISDYLLNNLDDSSLLTE